MLRYLIAFSLVFATGFAQDAKGVSSRTGKAAGYASRDATVLSIMGWGAGLAVGIATLCALVSTNDGSGGHSH